MVNNTRIGTKKSDFTGSTTIPSSATFDYVHNGQNLKILYSDFLSALGVTGTITQGGNPLGSPVLDQQGSTNVIRNVVGGFGITTSIDAQNSITFDVDFSFDTTGVAIVDDPLAEAPAFKSLVSGTDITITSASGIATINANTDGLKPTNRVIINQASDFPAASGGVITLAASTEYYIGDNITVSDRFDLSAGNIVVRGQAAACSITYTGTGDMFTAVDFTLLGINGVTLSQPNATTGDSLFDFSDSVTASSVANLMSINVLTCDTVLTYENIRGVTVDLLAVFSCNNGFIAQNTGTGTFSLGRVGIITTNATFVGIDLGTNIFTSMEVSNLQIFGVSGSVGIKGLASSGNILTGFIANIGNNEFIGGMTPLDTIVFTDFRFNFQGNSGISDTNPDGLLSLTANATNTVISAVNTPTLVAGTWVVEGVSHFTGDANGRLTYIAERDLTAPIDLVLDFEPVSGTNKDLRVCIAINGVAVVATCRLSRVDSGNPQSIASVWQTTFSTGDYIECFVENTTDAVDILVSGAVLRIR